MVLMVSLVTPLLKSLCVDQSTVYAGLARPLPPSVEAAHVQDGVVSVVGEVVDGVPGVDGTVVSISTLPAELYAEAFVSVSVALTRKYHVPSAKVVPCVYEVLFVVAVLLPLLKSLACDHCTL